MIVNVRRRAAHEKRNRYEVSRTNRIDRRSLHRAGVVLRPSRAATMAAVARRLARACVSSTMSTSGASRSACARATRSTGDRPGWNDMISSIKIFGRAEVIRVRGKDVRFRGALSRAVRTDVRADPCEARDGVTIRSRPRESETSSWGADRRPAWGGDVEMPGEGACFYQGSGAASCRSPCSAWRQLRVASGRGRRSASPSGPCRGANVMTSIDAHFLVAPRDYVRRRQPWPACGTTKFHPSESFRDYLAVLFLSHLIEKGRDAMLQR